MDTSLKYYELKQKYQDNLNRRKIIIKKNTDLDQKERRLAIKKLIGKCVSCNKPGGTIFEEKNGTLKAVCGSKTPCELNINIKRKLYDNVCDLEQKNNKRIESLKMLIIMSKLDYLFGLINSKDEVVDKFNTYKTELAQINETQMILRKKYGQVLYHEPLPLLTDAQVELMNEITELKKIYQAYLIEPRRPAYLTTMVEKYLTIIKPLTEKIRNINYSYYALESSTAATATTDDENEETISKAIYTLVALPYRLDQIEQERK